MPQQLPQPLPSGQQITKRRRFAAGLLAFLVPGAGHVVLKRLPSGLLLLVYCILDVLAIIYFANKGSGSHLLMIVMLCLALPAIYFYSVYDALQQAFRMQLLASQAEAQQVEATARQTIGLIIAALLLLVLVEPPGFIHPVLLAFGNYAAGIGLLALSGWMLWRLMIGSIRLGRLTSMVTLFVTGAVLIWDAARGSLIIERLPDWWLAVCLLFAAELLLYIAQWFRKQNRRRFSIDIIGIAAAAAAVTAVILVMQFADLPYRWIEQFNTAIQESFEYTEEQGHRYVFMPIHADLQEELIERVEIVNANGSIELRGGTGSMLRVERAVWIDLPDEQAAGIAAGQVKIELSVQKKTLKINVDAPEYGELQNRKPRVNLSVALPFLRASDHPGLEIRAKGVYGKLSVRNVPAHGGLFLDMRTGEIAAEQVTGNMEMRLKNGELRASYINGDAVMETGNGSLFVQQISGAVEARAQNGSMELLHIGGDLYAQTKNGSISIEEAAAAVHADTLNGAIAIRSSLLGGPWVADTAIGDIHLLLPEHSDFEVSGSVTFGDIESAFPLTIKGRTISGRIGTGAYPIRIAASSRIVLDKIQALQHERLH